MKVFEKKLYEELRDIEREMKDRLTTNMVNRKIKSFFEAELTDIQMTIQKLECGEFGKCEMSGELMPFDLLNEVPIAKTMNDFEKMKHYFKKPHFYN